MGEAKSSRGDYTASEDDNVLVQGVSGDKNALGYFGLAYYEENQKKLKLVPIDDGNDANGAGPVSPSMESVSNGTYQPLRSEEHTSELQSLMRSSDAVSCSKKKRSNIAQTTYNHQSIMRT